MCRSFLDDVLASMGRPEHERQFTVDWTHDCVCGKKEPGPRTGETCKHQTGNQSQRHQANENLDHGYDVAIESLRMHLPVSDCPQGFDAEEERASEAWRIQIGDAHWHEIVEATEEHIEGQEERRNECEQLRPANGHEEVVEILEDSWSQSLCEDL